MGITVSGVGERTGTPDTVEVDVGVSVLAGSVAKASAASAEGGQGVVAALTSAGVAATDIATTDYTIHPEYDYSDNRQRLTGYRVSNTVRAKIRDVSRAGDIIDAVATAGGDHSRINGLRFSIEDDTALMAAARAAAWNDAKTRATQLAELSRRKLGPATSITESVKSPIVPVRMMAADMAMAERAPTPIHSGTSTVTVTLLVEFDFES